MANALDTHQAMEPRLEVAIHGRTVHVQSAGYSALDRSAEDIAAARHLLETVLRRPVIVGRLRITRGTRIAGKRAKT